MRRHHLAHEHVSGHDSLATKHPAVGSGVLLDAGTCAESLIRTDD